MAITIKDSPATYQTAYNEMVYVCSSTNTAQPSFKYIFDIYIAGSGTKEVRLRVAPEPTTGNLYGICFINEVLENFLTQDIGDPAGVVGSTANANSIVDYIVKVGEEYEVAGVLTSFPDLQIDSTRYAWNGSYTYEDFVNFDYTTYIINFHTQKFLTNAPSTIDTMQTNSGWLYFMLGAPLATYFKLNTYDQNGASIGTWHIKQALTLATVDERHAKVAAAPITINALPNSEFASGVQPVFTGVEGSYNLQAFDATNTKISELRTFNIIDPCNFDRWNVLFLNRLGGFDSFTFKLLSRDTNEIKKTFYKKNPKRVADATGFYTYSLADREKVSFFTKSTRKRTLNSDWISEDESEWLEELMSSPVVYLEDANNNLISVNVTNTSWTKQTRVNDKLFNLRLELELNDNYRQRG